MTKEEFIEKLDAEIAAVQDEMSEKSSMSPEYANAAGNLVTLYNLREKALKDDIPKEVKEASKEDKGFWGKFLDALATPQVLCTILAGAFGLVQFFPILHWETHGNIFHLRESMSRVRRP